MRLALLVLFLFVALVQAPAQTPNEVLATAIGHTIRLADLSEQTRAAVGGASALRLSARKELFEQMVNQRLLVLEAASLGTSPGKMMADQKAKIADPTEAEITNVYELNRQALSGLSPAMARKRVVSFLRSAPEQKLIGELITGLRTKYKFVAGADVNAVGLSATDVVATVNLRPIIAKEFEDFARVELYELRASLGDRIMADLDDTLYYLLVADEAKAAGIEQTALIAREITNKLKEFSDDERIALETALAKQLYAKYNAKILYKRPAPLVQTISVDDDPGTGALNAPVTIVMFSDFQCSACSATYPVLKQAMAGFPGKIRFVVRDFPLESIHENAFRAALAAYAANAQGKFFDYTDILYRNQEFLDDASLRKYAVQIGLNVKQFELDFNSERAAAEVRKDTADGDSYFINSTPTIFVNGVRVRSLSPAALRAEIEMALAKTTRK